MSSRCMIQNVHIADGFVDDCEDLIQRCLQCDTLNFNVFCNIWKDMNFAYIFQGRMSGAEIAELSEEVVHIAKRYMLAETSNFEETVAGLFLVYSLLHLQPFRGFAALRVTPQDIDAIHHIENVAREQKRYDVLYILGSLLTQGPVQYHIADRDYGLEASYRKQFDPACSVEPAGVRARGVYYRQNEELALMRELASLSRRYTAAKQLVSGGQRPDVTLSYVTEQMASELATSLKQLVSGNNPANDPTGGREESASSIKHRAMKETVSQMRHIQSVRERQVARKRITSCLPVSPTKSEMMSKPGKVKIGSPKAPVPTNKRTPKRPRPRKATGKDTDSVKSKKSKKSEENPSVATNVATTPKSVKSVNSKISKISKKSVDTEIDANSTKSPKYRESKKSPKAINNNIKANKIITKAKTSTTKAKSRGKRKRTNSVRKSAHKNNLFNKESSSSNDDSNFSIKYDDSDIDVSTERERNSSIENAETIDDVILKLKMKEEAKKLRAEARKKAIEDRKRLEVSRKINMESIDDEIPIIDKNLVEVNRKVTKDNVDVPDLIMPDKSKRVRKKVHTESSSVITRGVRIKNEKESEEDCHDNKAPVLKKLPVHKMNRVHLKSRLRRMGVLDVLTGTEGNK